MDIQSYRPVTRSALGTDAPEWAGRILDPMNSNFELLYRALHGLLGFVANFNAEKKTDLRCFHETDFLFSLTTLRGRPEQILVLNTGDLFDFARLKWRVSSFNNRQVEASVSFDSAPSEAQKVTLLVLGN